MALTRRWFIGGLVASGAVGAHRLFAAAPGTLTDGMPRLRFGVVTDVHVRLKGRTTDFDALHGTETLQAAFEYFRSQGADAVLLTGDMADRGCGEELKAVADTFWRVFPDGKAPDGRRVEPVFMLGNHDWSGMKRLAKTFPDVDERARHAIASDPAKWWRECFHEDWQRAFRKDVKGYSFFGAHWCNGGDCRGRDEIGCDVLGDLVSANAPKIDPKLPFFYGQHPHPKDTCCSPWVWGQDNGAATKALTPFANAVAFSGHSHTSVTDERSIWQGAFTSIGCGSLRYISHGQNEFPPEGFENARTPKGPKSKALDALKVLKATSTYDGRQGLLVSVYDDRIVYRRREFVTGLSLGADWVMPLGNARPFAYAEHARRSRSPEFAEGTVVERSEQKAKNRKRQPVDAYVLAFAPADAVAGVRASHYEIEASAGTERKLFRLKAPGFCLSPESPKAKETCVFKVAKERCPKGDVAFTVTPVSSLGLKGRPLKVSGEAVAKPREGRAPSRPRPRQSAALPSGISGFANASGERE